MPRKLTALDRMRIERLVWTLDQRLYDLPRASRVAKRREVRANLLEAAADRGASEALRRLGGSGALAREYLGAEFGDRPHHSWTAAACFAALVPLFLFGGLSEVSSAYAQALTAGHAASGTYTWTGVSYLQSPLTFTVDHSQVTQAGGAFTPIVYVLWAVGTIVCGRLWRVLPLSSSTKRTPATES
ncbi:conserved hypothetical protein [Catenulispora acidiphila DSM 44928]|uniref:Uncharacterized protein n=1 Tax=Catenulispora acidiphila (strain DSM 44928 / JCM 14897 / NBRC 102108 / NRRL B-24433 / ID139908) TaxID=479433 RepID=C7QDM5_CATAD|nr:hypothetical protein [Catenulispora acidiphila]ACU74649.1 conserved hypothetical protein [Catenulispora acidiphila DSM 44928]